MAALKKMIIIAGPTASGKSGLAIAMAKRLGGEIINADSMQVYKDLSVLTARPSEADMKEIPHHLYGYLEANERCSAGSWLRQVEAVASNVGMPVVVGGTGFYIKALTEGIAEIPDIDPEVEKQAVKLVEEQGAEEFYKALHAADPLAEQLVDKRNKARLVRTYAVFHSTGQSIFQWQKEGHYNPLAGVEKHVFVLEPERQWLYRNCNERFEKMLEQGAVEEVRKVVASGKWQVACYGGLEDWRTRGLKNTNNEQRTTNNQLTKALGFKEIAGHLAGHWPLATGTLNAQQSTRNYAKRQLTWFRNQLEGQRLDPAALSMQQMGDAIIASQQ